MALVAARELALLGRERGLSETAILPRMEDPELVPRLATAVGLAAVAEGIADEPRTREQLLQRARNAVEEARAATDCWTRRLD
jgi:malic enzyme